MIYPPSLAFPPTLGSSFHNQWNRLRHLRSRGFEPDGILDIGAYHGGWSVLVKAVWPGVRVFTVEADEGCRAPLTRDGHDFEIAVLAEKDGEATFFRCNDREGEGNSLFPENSVHAFTPRTLPTKTLATVVGNERYDFIKMDCQGAELRVIAGGEQIVREAHVVLLETQIQNYNEGAPFTFEVMSWMEQLGFRLYDVLDFHYTGRGTLNQTDLMFARRDSPLFKTEKVF